MSFTTLIDAASLRALRADAAPRRPVVLDCRFDLGDAGAGRRAFLAGHIPGARYLDLNEDLSSPVTARSGRHPLPRPEALASRLAAAGVGFPPRGDAQMVAYDEVNGSFAARAWWLLRWLGFANVAVLDGGFRAWLADGGGVASGEGEPAAAVASGVAAARGPVPVAEERVASAAEVLLALRDPHRLLIDARAAERFSGKVEPLDPVAGHIPGAVNHPFGANLDAAGRFLPAADLRRLWLRRLGDVAPQDAIAMCGSGVTACHNLLAMAHAGLPGARLYAGSWSEWIRDPDRPVARGGPA